MLRRRKGLQPHRYILWRSGNRPRGIGLRRLARTLSQAERFNRIKAYSQNPLGKTHKFRVDFTCNAAIQSSRTQMPLREGRVSGEITVRPETGRQGSGGNKNEGLLAYDDHPG